MDETKYCPTCKEKYELCEYHTMTVQKDEKPIPSCKYRVEFIEQLIYGYLGRC